jgi:hypothetical protein
MIRNASTVMVGSKILLQLFQNITEKQEEPPEGSVSLYPD